MENPLLKRRKELGLTRRRVAIDADCTEEIIRLLESGEHKNPGIQLLWRLAKALNCDVTDIFPETTVVRD